MTHRSTGHAGSRLLLGRRPRRLPTTFLSRPVIRRATLDASSHVSGCTGPRRALARGAARARGATGTHPGLSPTPAIAAVSVLCFTAVCDQSLPCASLRRSSFSRLCIRSIQAWPRGVQTTHSRHRGTAAVRMGLAAQQVAPTESFCPSSPPRNSPSRGTSTFSRRPRSDRRMGTCARCRSFTGGQPDARSSSLKGIHAV